jgi:hypothetical protein
VGLHHAARRLAGTSPAVGSDRTDGQPNPVGRHLQLGLAVDVEQIQNRALDDDPKAGEVSLGRGAEILRLPLVEVRDRAASWVAWPMPPRDFLLVDANVLIVGVPPVGRRAGRPHLAVRDEQRPRGHLLVDEEVFGDGQRLLP